MANTMGALPPTELLPMLDRFLAKVQKKSDGCWQWLGTIRSKDRKYKQGVFSICRGKNIAAHHFAWLTHKRALPKGKCLMHTCDNGLCVNPAHLKVGTPAENNKDRANKCRSATGFLHGRYTQPASNCVGARNGSARLTESNVRDIRFICSAPIHPTLNALAKEYGVSISAMCSVVNKKTWRHV